MVEGIMKKIRFLWQLALAWLVGLLSFVNSIAINIFPIETLRSSFWVYSMHISVACCFVVMLNTFFRESIERRKITWILLSASFFLLFWKLVFRLGSHNNENFVVAGVFVFMILGLIVFFPKSTWSLGSVTRSICDILVLSFSAISLLQSGIYYFFGATESAQSAAAYSIWVGFEIAGLITTMFLWYYYRQAILGLVVLAAICIVLADGIGTIRQWFYGPYRVSGFLDNSFNYLQDMLIMMFAYYSVNGFVDLPSYKQRIITRIEWYYRAGVPRVAFVISLAVAILVQRPDEWVIGTLLAVGVVQMIVAAREEYLLVERLFRTQAELAATNARLLAAQRDLQDALQQIESLTLANERSRLAREIHDGMGAHLHAAITLASALTDDDASDPDTRRILQRAVGEIEQARDEMRQTIGALQAGTELSLEEMLAGPVYDARTYGVRMELRVLGTPRPVPTAVRHALYRVAQEAVTNIGKHAQASQASLTIDYTDSGALVLLIRDNGVGVRRSAARLSGGGNGLANIRARIEALGGRMELPPAEQGVTLWMRVPLR